MQNAIIDVAIGLVFAYLVLSLFATALQEWIAQLLKWRAKMLEMGIRQMLGSEPLGPRAGGRAISLADMVLSHASITALAADGKLPAYIPPQAFSAALTDSIARLAAAGSRALAQGTLANIIERPAMNDALYAAATGVTEDLQKARQSAEAWFDEGMERVSGWYKRKIRMWMVGISLVLAMAFNVDSISLAQRLYADPALRTAVAESSSRFASNPANASATPAVVNANLRKELDKIGVMKLPVGWPVEPASPWYLVALGWIITGLAVSLGAPFWFDTLSKLGSLRSSGQRPAKSGQETIPPAKGIAPAHSFLAIQAAPGAAATEGPAFEESRLSRHDVKDLQAALGLADAQLTGLIDDATRVAIRQKQRQLGLAETGAFDAELVRRLLP